MTSTTGQNRRDGLIAGCPYFAPAWLYIPYLFYVVPLAKGIDDSLLFMVLIVPLIASMSLALVPLYRKRVSPRQFCWLLIPPYAALALWVISIIDLW